MTGSRLDPLEMIDMEYVGLLKWLSRAYTEKADACGKQKDIQREMFFIGKRDATEQALKHYLEITNDICEKENSENQKPAAPAERAIAYCSTAKSQG